MTHLRIELLEGTSEYITSSGAKKLYDICKNDTLDNTSNLQGTCHIQGGGYAVYKTYLETMFPHFHLTMDREYFVINDSEFEKVLALNWGDGYGISATQMLDVKDTNNENWIPLEILTNSNIKDLSELQYCTGIAGIQSGNYFSYKTKFDSMTSLEKIVFPNTLGGVYGRYGAWIFNNLSNLKYVDFNGMSRIVNAFGGALSNLETIILGEGCTYIDSLMNGLSSLTKVTSIQIPSTLTRLHAICYTKITSINIPSNVEFVGALNENTLLSSITFEDAPNKPLTINGGSYAISGFLQNSAITTLIFPDRPITFSSNGIVGLMPNLTTVVFKRKPVSIDWSKFLILLVPSYGLQKYNNIQHIYLPDADYNDMVADIQAANTNYSRAQYHLLSEYTGTL